MCKQFKALCYIPPSLMVLFICFFDCLFKLEMQSDIKMFPTKKILTPKPHILDINGVWYSTFWSKESKKHLNIKLESFGFKFCHQRPQMAAHLGPRGAAI